MSALDKPAVVNITSDSLLLVAGATLLGVAAFMGFAQAKAQGGPTESMWRGVHNGGTAGGVQLIALAAVWGSLSGANPWGGLVALSVTLSTWLFFVGPLLKVLGRLRAASVVLGFGAVVALPAYAGLIVLAVEKAWLRT